MTTTSPITGDPIVSHATTDAYRNGSPAVVEAKLKEALDKTKPT